MTSTEIVPFGKYKGQPIEVMANDKQYCEWLNGQDWFRTRYSSIRTIIINNFNAPEETPEHNALQAQFTNEDWVKAFIIVDYGGEEKFKNYFEHERQRAIDTEIKNMKHAVSMYKSVLRSLQTTINPSNTYWGNSKEYFAEELKRHLKEINNSSAFILNVRKALVLPHIVNTAYEVEGADVLVEWGISFTNGARKIRVECKPSMGDDYPAILRQMKSNNCRVLLIGTGGYTGTGATMEQVKKIFNSSGISIIKLLEKT